LIVVVVEFLVEFVVVICRGDDRGGPFGYFIHTHITTRIVSALKKMLHLQLPRSPSGHFKPLL
jgi:hypothetical protein